MPPKWLVTTTEDVVPPAQLRIDGFATLALEV